MNETVAMKYNADLSRCKVNIRQIWANLLRKIQFKTRRGNRNGSGHIVYEVPTKGCTKGNSIDDVTAVFDLSVATDPGTPSDLTGELAQFSGRLQQTCTGTLINCFYELHATAEIDGNLCLEYPPTAYIPVEVLAPETMLQFIPLVPIQNASPSQNGPQLEQVPYDPEAVAPAQINEVQVDDPNEQASASQVAPDNQDMVMQDV